MDLIISCVSRMARNASSVYLHHSYLIFLAGTDTALHIPSSMRSWVGTSFTTPWRRLCPTRRSAWCIHPSRRRPSPHGVKGLPLVGARDLLLLRGRIPGLRSTHLK